MAGATLALWDEVLKTFYLPDIREQLNHETILADLIEMNREQSMPMAPEPEGGICEYCGTFSNDLRLSNGMMMCESCRDTEGYYD